MTFSFLFLDDLSLAELRLFWFRQDGATPHFAAVVREWLNLILPDRWIGRGKPVPWPTRSPDLNPLDFFLWSYLKSKVNEDSSETLQQLLANIGRECALITLKTIESILNEWGPRATQC